MPNNKKHKREKSKPANDKTRDSHTDIKGPITLTKKEKRALQLVCTEDEAPIEKNKQKIFQQHEQQIFQTVYLRYEALIVVTDAMLSCLKKTEIKSWDDNISTTISEKRKELRANTCGEYIDIDTLYKIYIQNFLRYFECHNTKTTVFCILQYIFEIFYKEHRLCFLRLNRLKELYLQREKDDTYMKNDRLVQVLQKIAEEVGPVFSALERLIYQTIPLLDTIRSTLNSEQDIEHMLSKTLLNIITENTITINTRTSVISILCNSVPSATFKTLRNDATGRSLLDKFIENLIKYHIDYVVALKYEAMEIERSTTKIQSRMTTVRKDMLQNMLKEGRVTKEQISNAIKKVGQDMLENKQKCKEGFAVDLIIQNKLFCITSNILEHISRILADIDLSARMSEEEKKAVTKSQKDELVDNILEPVYSILRQFIVDHPKIISVGDSVEDTIVKTMLQDELLKIKSETLESETLESETLEALKRREILQKIIQNILTKNIITLLKVVLEEVNEDPTLLIEKLKKEMEELLCDAVEKIMQSLKHIASEKVGKAVIENISEKVEEEQQQYISEKVKEEQQQYISEKVKEITDNYSIDTVHLYLMRELEISYSPLLLDKEMKEIKVFSEEAYFNLIREIVKCYMRYNPSQLKKEEKLKKRKSLFKVACENVAETLSPEKYKKIEDLTNRSGILRKKEKLEQELIHQDEEERKQRQQELRAKTVKKKVPRKRAVAPEAVVKEVEKSDISMELMLHNGRKAFVSGPTDSVAQRVLRQLNEHEQVIVDQCSNQYDSITNNLTSELHNAALAGNAVDSGINDATYKQYSGEQYDKVIRVMMNSNLSDEGKAGTEENSGIDDNIRHDIIEQLPNILYRKYTIGYLEKKSTNTSYSPEANTDKQGKNVQSLVFLARKVDYIINQLVPLLNKILGDEERREEFIKNLTPVFHETATITKDNDPKYVSIMKTTIMILAVIGSLVQDMQSLSDKQYIQEEQSSIELFLLQIYNHVAYRDKIKQECTNKKEDYSLSLRNIIYDTIKASYKSADSSLIPGIVDNYLFYICKREPKESTKIYTDSSEEDKIDSATSFVSCEQELASRSI